MTSPRRIVSSLFPTRSLAPAVATLQRHWRAAPLEEEGGTLTGVIAGARLGHLQDGELTLDVDGTEWTVEVGQPWRSQRAGLQPSLLAKGATVTVIGHRHAQPQQRLFRAEQVVVDGRTFELFPDHD